MYFTRDDASMLCGRNKQGDYPMISITDGTPYIYEDEMVVICRDCDTSFVIVMDKPEVKAVCPGCKGEDIFAGLLCDTKQIERRAL